MTHSRKITRADGESDLAREGQSFQLLFEHTPMPLLVYDVETLSILEVNAAAVCRYGWSREQFRHMSVADLRPHDASVVGQDAIPRDLKTQATLLVTHVAADGELLKVRIAVHSIDFQDRRANLAVIWDVTEVEQAREALRGKNEALARLTETLTTRSEELIDATRLAGIGLWRVAMATGEIFWSPETFAILGLAPRAEPVTKRDLLACVHPEDHAHFKAGYREILRSGSDHQMEYRIIRPSGETRVLRELARPQRGPGGKLIGIAGVIQDVTEQKIAQDALLRSEKLKTVGQITGGIAHDFNNLLAVIGLNIEAVIEDDALPEPLRAILVPALHAARRSAELTAQLLSYARRQSLQPRVLDLQVLLTTLRPLLERAVGERHALTLVEDDEAGFVEIDPGQFENAIMNLVINARDALGAHGRIELAVGSDHVTKRRPLFPDTIPAGAYVRVEVRDNGQGIDPSILQRILEPFFTTKPIGLGSGLGLSMVYGFVRQSKGFMAIASGADEGTTIAIYFPTVAQAAETTTPASGRPKLRARGMRALVVEDRADLRGSISRTLEGFGFETESVAVAEDALAMLHAGPRFDLMLTDILLSGAIDGIVLAEQAERLHPGLVVVLTSGDPGSAQAGRLGSRVLAKPFTGAALGDLLARLLVEPSGCGRAALQH